MNGISDLATLLATLAPVLDPECYVFVSRPTAVYGDGVELEPIASVAEVEGLTLIVRKEMANASGDTYDGEFRRIGLTVHSDLHAVGLTAAIATAFSQEGISANVVAGFYHDHIFVPAERSADAMIVLSQLADQNQ
ncbi:ACT domain-containing protein [Mariniblastus fucicola]|nr:ACT domain-containing protein [Mariniblastus fucicola]